MTVSDMSALVTVSQFQGKTRSLAVAMIADRSAYDVRYTGKLSNRFRIQVI